MYVKINEGGLMSGGLMSGGLMSGGLMSGRLMSGGRLSGRLMSGGWLSGRLMSGGLMSGGLKCVHRCVVVIEASEVESRLPSSSALQSFQVSRFGGRSPDFLYYNNENLSISRLITKNTHLYTTTFKEQNSSICMVMKSGFSSCFDLHFISSVYAAGLIIDTVGDCFPA